MEVVHTADTHLGFRQYGSSERRRDFVRAFREVAEDTVESDAEILVHAGDLFHSRNPGLDDIIEVIDIFKFLDRNDVTSLAVVGNHERKRSSQWIDLLENLDVVERLSRDPVEIGDSAFYGVDYLPPSRIEGFDYSFEETDRERKFLVLHGRFEPFPYGEWSLGEFVEKSEVEWSGFLLGDYHHYEFEYVEGVPATYCGSTERVSAEERETRGYNVIDTDEVDFSRRSIETRDFVFVEIEIGEDAGERSATQKVVDRCLDYEVKDSVVLVDITGDSDRNVVKSEVEEELRDRGALVSRIKDKRETPETDEEIEVSFSDPDQAVREKIREMELSSAAVEIDKLVRGSQVADSNIADHIENDVMEIVENNAEKLIDTPQSKDDGDKDERTSKGDGGDNVRTSKGDDGNCDGGNHDDDNRDGSGGDRLKVEDGEDMVEDRDGSGQRSVEDWM